MVAAYWDLKILLLSASILQNWETGPSWVCRFELLVKHEVWKKRCTLIIDCPVLNWFNKALNPFNTILLRLYTPI